MTIAVLFTILAILLHPTCRKILTLVPSRSIFTFSPAQPSPLYVGKMKSERAMAASASKSLASTSSVVDETKLSAIERRQVGKR